MSVAASILFHSGKILLNSLPGGFAGDVFFEALPEIAMKIWKAWSAETTEAQRCDQLEAIAQAPQSEVCDTADGVLKSLGSGRSPEDLRRIRSYLEQIPFSLRQLLRRADDPQGITVPPGFTCRTAQDVLRILPAGLPRFNPGDRPLAGVDLELVEQLGTGGFGEVWRARNPHLPSSDDVALKFCLDATASKALRREVLVLNRVMQESAHPGIVQLRRTYLSAEPPCLEYDLIDGGDLTGFIHELSIHNHHSPLLIAATILEIAESVAFVHEKDPPIVHRDIKPSNILTYCNAEGKVRFMVTDFGIGGIVSESNALVGTAADAFSTVNSLRGSHTPLYSSPQQKRGDEPRTSDDVYSLGVVWYQLLLRDVHAPAPTGRRWKSRLKKQGMNDDQIDLLELCFEDHQADRPLNARILCDRIRECYMELAQDTESVIAVDVIDANYVDANEADEWEMDAQVADDGTTGVECMDETAVADQDAVEEDLDTFDPDWLTGDDVVGGGTVAGIVADESTDSGPPLAGLPSEREELPVCWSPKTAAHAESSQGRKKKSLADRLLLILASTNMFLGILSVLTGVLYAAITWDLGADSTRNRIGSAIATLILSGIPIAVGITLGVTSIGLVRRVEWARSATFIVCTLALPAIAYLSIVSFVLFVVYAVFAYVVLMRPDVRAALTSKAHLPRKKE